MKFFEFLIIGSEAIKFQAGSFSFSGIEEGKFNFKQSYAFGETGYCDLHDDKERFHISS